MEPTLIFLVTDRFTQLNRSRSVMESSSESEDFSDTVFWLGSSSEWAADENVDDENEDSVNSDHEEKTAFWHGQEQLLLATLCRTTPMESRVRHATEEAVWESAPPCLCRREAAAGGWRSCSRKKISDRLCRARFHCSIRNSKWNKSSNIPSGEHTYMEVVEEKRTVIVELHFKAEFEMARGGDHYNRFVSLLPEVFVGKPEKLKNLVKMLTGATKKCMKENNMHVPPWRKLKYMQSKWLSTSTTCEKKISSTTSDPPQEVAAAGFSGGRSSRRPRASMLTFAFALLENFPRCKAVAVV